MTIAFFVAILGVYLVLASQFNDYFQPIIIISAIAFSLIGVVCGMFLTRSTFTVGSFMAVVGLAGVAVNDAILMIEFMNVRIGKGIELRQAVMDGSSIRLRPVLLTTITTIFGLLPMAIGIPNKSISWSPMATAFVTGLASSTTLTLLIVPVEYEILEKFKRFRKKKLKLRQKEV
ncbi:Acriflavin resistance protein [Candidatus Magnetoovum chiemensis]|nr:Acriflavin resistance protein [Candidatus Magnetoovum chiemensis]